MTEDPPVLLTANQWRIAEKVVNILGPSLEATADMSADDACISTVIPTVSMLCKKTAFVDELDSNVKTMKATLIDYLKQHFMSLEDIKEYAVVILLYSQFEDNYFLSARMFSAAMPLLLLIYCRWLLSTLLFISLSRMVL